MRERERLIKLKNPKLRKIRLEFRRVLLKDYQKRLNEFHEERARLQAKRAALVLSYDNYLLAVRPVIDQASNLRKNFSASIVVCATCRDIEGDHIFSLRDKVWYCLECYEILEKSYMKEIEALKKLN